jgi:hypothetical protein
MTPVVNGRPRRPFTITAVRCDAAGVWRARVTDADGVTVDVDRSSGSWQALVRRAPRSRDFVRREVLPHVALALQDRVRQLDADAAPSRRARKGRAA